MKNLLITSLCLMISLAAAIPASADTLSIAGIGSMPYYGGEYVGPIGAWLNGNTIAGGIICNDISTITYVPNSGYAVDVSTLSPKNLTKAKFDGSNQLFKYQEAAWLLGQMASHSSLPQIGDIQFAIWSIFNSTATGTLSKSEQDWLDSAAVINPADYDFSSVRIYTALPASSNQEFMSGAAKPVTMSGAANSVTEPATILLLGLGLIGLAGFVREKS